MIHRHITIPKEKLCSSSPWKANFAGSFSLVTGFLCLSVTTLQWVEESRPTRLSLQLLLTEQGYISINYEFPGKKILLSCQFGEVFFSPLLVQLSKIERLIRPSSSTDKRQLRERLFAQWKILYGVFITMQAGPIPESKFRNLDCLRSSIIRPTLL